LSLSTTPGDLGPRGRLAPHGGEFLQPALGRARGALSGASPRHRLPSYDIALQSRDRSQHLALLLLRNFKFVEALDQVFDAGVPVRLGDVEAGMRGLQVWSGVLAGPAGSDPQECWRTLIFESVLKPTKKRPS
jgi:hypothetical protein